MNPTKLAPGTVLAGRFTIQSEAGRGGMGVVYRAKDQSTGSDVALKLLDAERLRDHALPRFMREAKVLSELRHPGVVGYVAHGTLPDGGAFLAMEWVEGEELGKRLTFGPLPMSHCVSILNQVTSALCTIHSRGIVHRDIKPSNILLRNGRFDQIVILDFGIARHILGDGSLTGSGVLVGTPEYMAPEQARAESDIGPGADIFSLGCVIYQCLTGRHPFPAEHLAAMLARILFEECPPVVDLRPRTPPELCSLVHRMLSKDPARRPKNAMALQDELQALSIASIDEELTETLVPSIPAAALTGGEQGLVSVVLGSMEQASPLAASLVDTAAQLRSVPDNAALVHDLAAFGAQVEWLADGSIVATLSRVGGSAMDLVTAAARCALIVQERLSEARVALATGRGVLRVHMPAMGEAIDRAVSIAHKRRAEAPLKDGALAAGVWLDEASAGLLDGRFVQTRVDGFPLLTSERMSVDESRLLCGKPTPCVGRELELGPIESLFSGSIEESVARAVLITAPAGTGKSRLRHELVRRLTARYPEVNITLGRADPQSAGSPYGLLSQALRARFGIQSGVTLAEQRQKLLSALSPLLEAEELQHIAERIGELCGVPFPDDNNAPLRAARTDPSVMYDEIRLAFLDWLRAECNAAPVMLVLEDLQWSDPLTVKLIDTAVRELSDLPLMVLVLARPEVADLFPKPWPWVAHEISLRPLSKKASERLVREVLGPDVAPATLQRILEQAEGNALYLEELIRAAAEGHGDEAPETLLVMLQARLLRLDPTARRVLRAASVFGETFWSRGVRHLNGGSDADVAKWLKHLVDAEILEPRRDSRFPGEIEHRFRHTLLREAAYRLLTDSDREAGHLRASHYLEKVGEDDPMVIAEHSERGGDRARALPYYVRATEQSWELNDIDSVLSRVERCIACGASGEVLGVVRALESHAYFSKADFARTNATATEAIALLPPGSLWWCRAIEKLCYVLPHIGQGERLVELSRLALSTEPESPAITAYIIAISYPVATLAMMGARAPARSFLEKLESPAILRVIEADSLARGWAKICRGWYVRFLEPDPFLAMLTAHQSCDAFGEACVPQNVAMATCLLGVTKIDLGDRDAGERMLRDGLSLASHLSDDYLLLTLGNYLSLTLAERSERELQEEGWRIARGVVENQSRSAGPAFLAAAHITIATVLLSQGRLAEAEAEALKGCELRTVAPVFLPLAMAALIRARLRQGRVAEACESAEDGLRALADLGGVGWCEVTLHAAVAEAFHAAGELDRALDALREGLRQIAIRAEKIADRAWRERYLNGRPENTRMMALAREWLGPEGAEWEGRLRGAPTQPPGGAA